MRISCSIDWDWVGLYASPSDDNANYLSCAYTSAGTRLGDLSGEMVVSAADNATEVRFFNGAESYADIARSAILAEGESEMKYGLKSDLASRTPTLSQDGVSQVLIEVAYHSYVEREEMDWVGLYTKADESYTQYSYVERTEPGANSGSLLMEVSGVPNGSAYSIAKFFTSESTSDPEMSWVATPLHIAVGSSFDALLQALLDRKLANVAELHRALLERTTEELCNPEQSRVSSVALLGPAALREVSEAVQRKAGADKGSSLRLACQLGLADLADAFGDTPLHHACRWGHTACALALLDVLGRSAQHAAQCMQIVNNQGKTAVELALDNAVPEIVQRFLSMGLPSRDLLRLGFASSDACDAVCRWRVSGIAQGLRAGKGLFVDNDFPPNASSLWKDPRAPAQGIVVPERWARVQELCEGVPQLFDAEIAFSDIEQGGIGTCYLLAAIAALAETAPAFLRDHVFYSTLLDELGCAQLGLYALRLYNDRGRAVFVVMDDHVPCAVHKRHGDKEARLQPVYAHTRTRTAWYVALIEKAYAKLRGTYEAIDAGCERYAKEALTGGVSNVLYLTSWELRRERQRGTLWPRVAGLLSDPTTVNLLTCTIDPALDAEARAKGLISGHAYTLLRAVCVGRRHHLVKLLNPYGDEEWHGAWSDRDTKSWTAQLRAQAGLAEAASQQDDDDGTFFIEFESDFLRYFTTVDVCAFPREAGAGCPASAVALCSRALPRDPVTMLALRVTGPGALLATVAQQTRDPTDVSADEVTLVLGTLPNDVFALVPKGDQMNTTERVVVRENSVFDAMTRHMTALGRVRPTTEKHVSLEVYVADEVLRAVRSTVFLVVMYRPVQVPSVCDALPVLTVWFSPEPAGCGDGAARGPGRFPLLSEVVPVVVSAAEAAQAQAQQQQAVASEKTACAAPVRGRAAPTPKPCEDGEGECDRRVQELQERIEQLEQRLEGKVDKALAVCTALRARVGAMQQQQQSSGDESSETEKRASPGAGAAAGRQSSLQLCQTAARPAAGSPSASTRSRRAQQEQSVTLPPLGKK
eukprot:m51a1_g6649 putative calpain-5 (1042) ;mRNA; f:127553-135070